MRLDRSSVLLASGFALLAAPLFSQAPQIRMRALAPESEPQEAVFLQRKAEAISGDVVYFSAKMSMGGKVVKQAPFSAEAVTETIQALSDGNRIRHQSTSQIYRDSEGRTRREHALDSVGPWAAAKSAGKTVVIHDPVAKTSYLLEPQTKTVRKLPAAHLEITHAAGAPEKQIVVEKMRRQEGAHSVEATEVAATPVFEPAQPGADTKTEPLGRKVMEGVVVEGTKTTTTIPAGAIGNDQPLQIVSERWYSPELQEVVLSRRNDPRFGETTYRLTNVNRSEPSKILFEVPADFTLREDLHRK